MHFVLKKYNEILFFFLQFYLAVFPKSLTRPLMSDMQIMLCYVLMFVLKILNNNRVLSNNVTTNNVAALSDNEFFPSASLAEYTPEESFKTSG